MSKTSNKQKLECLRAWIDNVKVRAKKKVKKQPYWLKDQMNKKDEN